MLDIRKRAAFSDLLLAVTALGRSTAEREPARPPASRSPAKTVSYRTDATPPAPMREQRYRDRGADGLRVGARRRHRRALVGIVPSAVLKLGLGVILIVSAWRTFRHSQQPAVQTAGAPAT